MTTEVEGLPDTGSHDVYDDGWPDYVAGHVEAGAVIDPASDHVVTATGGIDIGYEGEGAHRETRTTDERHGSAETEKRIQEVVSESREAAKRTSVSNVASSCVYGNETLADTSAKRILLKNANRKRVTITNQGGSLVAVGNRPNIAIVGGVPTPNAGYLPNGAGQLSVKVIESTDEVWVVGAAGGIVDWVEENYL